MLTSGDVVHVGSPAVDSPLEGVQIVQFHNFEQLPTTKDVAVFSPMFSCAGHQWRLAVCPGGLKDSEDGMMAAGLISVADSKITASVQFIIKNSDGTIFKKCTRRERLFGQLGESTVCANFAKRESILGTQDVLDNGALVFEVRIRPAADCYCNYYAKPQGNLTKNVLKLFLDEESADVAFQVKGHTFHAHRAILNVQVPELADLCDSCDKTNPFPINDVEPELFEIMLKHAYGAEIHAEDWKNKAEAILCAAGKYGFDNLKCEAEAWHVKNIKFTTDNAIDHLLQADGNDFPAVKNAAMKFILENAKDVVASEAYVRLDESPTLRKEVMVAMSENISLGNKRKREN